MTSSLRVRIAGTVLILLTLTGVLARTGQAQPRFEWPDRAKNLKVLPKDLAKEKLQATMVGFTRSLGVRCPFCHVGQEGQPLTTFDFASDQKPMKQVARGMMKLVKKTNEDIRKMNIPEPRHVEVQCVTCHRGRPRPFTLADDLAYVYGSAGIDSTVARYTMLRERFYGAGSYDFSERSLNEFGSNLLVEGHPADAVRIFQLNVEQNPNSSFAYASLGDAYAASGQKEPAIQAYEKAVQLDPRNREADQKLKSLREGK
ncbi:MAG TPA: c-type cytochrome [Candidatus Dormibacteraeota bacterium]|nr:c-type cytochrome [Candidatus Dormibacteraeota bacterium]